jgi:endonuclease/exonuclease/phosphatase family metal-dependent hydrolase
MNIATWNIWWWFISKNNNLDFDKENLDYFIEEIRWKNLDIIWLQEIHNSNWNNQTKIIAQLLWFKYFKIKEIADSHIKDWEKLCISIISNHPINSFKFHKLINPLIETIYHWKKILSHDKWFLEVEIKYNNLNKIRILSGHMVPFHNFWKNFLDNEFINIRKQIEKIILNSNIPTIVLADMNFENIDKLIPSIFNRWFTSLLDLNEYTTPKDKKIDKIIISKDFNCKKTSIIKWRADHFLCLSDIEIKSN